MKSRQYTIRNVPDSVDSVLRKRAQESRKSFNQVALEALAAGANQSLKPKRDFSGIAGTLPSDEAAWIEAEVRRQRQIDPELWS
jgi:plasmid stability protein